MRLIFIFIFLMALSFIAKADQVVIRTGTQSLSLSKSNIPNKYKGIWTQKKAFDDLSQQELTYKGYPLIPLLQKLEKDWNLKPLKQIKVKAKDGYILFLNPSQYNSNLSFLALEVEGLSTKGLFVKDFNKYVDWRPSYLVLDKKKSSNPYQVVEIELLTEIPENFAQQFPQKYKDGAQIFSDNCLKCHGYKTWGGFKGPPLNIVLKAWPENNKLKTFLKDPQKYKNGNSGMSSYDGGDKDLNTLVTFLRFIEDK